jgi:HTH-type transcriptional repressor of NAD biosynthesis genes
MTALPPTKGHLRLLQFSNDLADHTVALVCTQPSEPFAGERFMAVLLAAKGLRVTVRQVHKELEQNPEAPGFWAMWKNILQQHGFREGDYIVASETYGVKFAEEMGGHFIPYDPYREILPIKATIVRESLEKNFADILPEFQHNLITRVTLFGAESTGKSTLSRRLAEEMPGHYMPEWARPYMEICGADMTTQAMVDIWEGQRALQRHARFLLDKPYIIQDTDLFSTVGYWDFWNGETPQGLINDAHELKSDIYLICQGNIPFEPDPLRFGGDHRESPDQFWIDLAEKHGLNYKVIHSADFGWREVEARVWAGREFDKKAKQVATFARAYN